MALTLSATAALAILLHPILEGEISSGLIFVLGIMLVGATSGLLPAFISAILASFAFNLIIVDPPYSFGLPEVDNLAPPLIFAACALISGVLSGQLKDTTHKLRRTNLQLEGLFEISRLLQAAPELQAAARVIENSVPELFGFRLALFVLQDDVLQPLTDDRRHLAFLDLARRTLVGETIGENGKARAFRLDGSRACVGVIVAEHEPGQAPAPELISALANLLALTIERAQLSSILAEAEARARTEELKTALLSSVSHDLRTPLTAISAAASSLVEYREQLDEKTSSDLLTGIVEDCDRLNRFTSNLLEMSRLEAGKEMLASTSFSIVDLVATAAQAAQRRHKSHQIEIREPDRDALIVADAALFELALTNILENAVKYSDPDSTILVEVGHEDRFNLVCITDEGRGIPEDELPHIFERFYRARHCSSSTSGSGLGLAIAKGFVEAFGGSIEVRSPASIGRGTAVIIRLPDAEKATT